MRSCATLLFLNSWFLLSAQQRPPVVLVNGFQIACDPTATSAGTFGNLQQYLTQDGAAVYFFNNCQYPGASIETLGQDFGKYLASLKNLDGTAVTTVDVVAHSMGGLIVRSYLSGKQNTAGLFQPPAAPALRKLILLATPNFGTPVASLASFLGPQASEMALGSAFLWDLNTWLQNADDLRGVDSLAVIGNAAIYSNGSLTLQNASDGVVSLTSASLAFSPFAPPERTRIVPYCHTNQSLFPCNGPAIANVNSTSQLPGQIIRSFLAGSTDWASIGATPGQDPVLSRYGGSLLEFETAAGSLASASNVTFGTPATAFQSGAAATFYAEFVPAASATLSYSTSAGAQTTPFTIPAGGAHASLIRPSPLVYRVQTAAAAVPTLDLAAGSLISIYGAGLSSLTASSSSATLPLQLGNVTVSAGGNGIPLLYVSPTQINAYLPADLSGLVPLEVKNPGGAMTLNLLLDPAVPAIFTQDASGTGAAAALHNSSEILVTPSNPAAPGEYLQLYCTGLGATHVSGGLDVTTLAAQVFLGSPPVSLPVVFSGLAPGFTGLYQVNFQIPAGIPTGMPSGSAVPLYVVVGARTSNTVTLAVQ
jgi:uncharacterized protein (TIGR03437 family)